MSRLFVSYNREDGEGGLVADFVQDLAQLLARRAGWPKDESVYLDTSMPVGTRWSDELIGALGRCSIFMPLLSPRLFHSEYCGREWMIFEHRLREQFRHHPMPGLIIPVLWEAREDLAHLPAVAQDVQFDDGKAHPVYLQRGLRQLAQLRGSFKEEYWATVDWLAGRSKDAANRWQLPQSTTPLTIANATNAFEHAIPGPAPGQRPPPAPSGPRHAHFVVVAGTTSEVPRERLEGYGTRAEDWRPFLPEGDDPAALYALQVAGEQHIVGHLSPVARDIQELIELAESDNSLVIVLVDPWSASLPAFQDQLAKYDRRLSLNTGAIVAWNGYDAETTSNRPGLQQALHRILRNSRRARPTVCRDSPETLEDFKTELHALLVEVQSLVFATGEVARPARSAEVIRRPMIQGVVGAADV